MTNNSSSPDKLPLLALVTDDLDETPRHDGWTPARQVRFLKTYVETFSVDKAAEAVGLTRQSAFQLRWRNRLFAEGWEAARHEMHRNLLREVVAQDPSVSRSQTFQDGKLIRDRISKNSPKKIEKIKAMQADAARTLAAMSAPPEPDPQPEPAPEPKKHLQLVWARPD